MIHCAFVTFTSIKKTLSRVTGVISDIRYNCDLRVNASCNIKYFNLQPTEKPTTVATTEPIEEEHEQEHEEEHKERKKNKVKHHHHRVTALEGGVSHIKNFLGLAAQKKPKTNPKEDEPEDEEAYKGPHSPATFAIVIGLSCGALVIMIMIVIAMAMRKSRGNNPTRTVLIDPDADGNSEKQHLANLQQNGYENPIYKLSSY